MNGHLVVAKMLVDHGAGIEAKSMHDELTALMFVAMNGHLDVAKMLVDQGAGMEVRNNSHNELTALMFAARMATPTSLRCWLIMELTWKPKMLTETRH
jgi:ankyrin repeat protein